MKGDDKVIEYLNKALRQELAAINQYFLHSRMFNEWGLHRLGKKEYEESIEEMVHADKLIQRILFLEGLPNLQTLDKLFIGENVKDCLEGDLKAEKRAHPMYKEAIAWCEEVSDFVSREIFVKILEDEEEHIDWLETQLDLIERIGLENYTQSQIGDAAE
jgi:bacterioferritin